MASNAEIQRFVERSTEAAAQAIESMDLGQMFGEEVFIESYSDTWKMEVLDDLQREIVKCTRLLRASRRYKVLEG